MFILAGGCAAYTAIELPYRVGIQEDFHRSESIERGALLFANNCRGCHGDEGQGAIGPPLNPLVSSSSDDFQNQDPLIIEQKKEKVRRTLFCGRVNTVMQPWLNTVGGSLNEVQIEHLVDLVTDPTGVGWEEAVEFSHNLNHHALVGIGGDTLALIAKTYRIGVAEIVELNSEYAADDILPKGEKIELPPNSQFEDGRIYKVTQGNETLIKIADQQRVGESILADLNGLTFDHNPKKNMFVIYENGEVIPGLNPGQTLRLTNTGAYSVVVDDTLQSIADRLGIGVDDLTARNASVADLDPEIAFDEDDGGLVLALPAVNAMVVLGDSLADVAQGFANTSAESLGEENGVEPDAVLRIGELIALPPDSWGVVPAGTINNGTACVEHAVPASVFQQLTGQTEDPDAPSEISAEVEVLAHANDWEVVADGAAQPINEGLVSIEAGTTVRFQNVVGVHTITINGEKRAEDILGTDFRDIVFDEAGSFKITCDYHPDMLAWIFVPGGSSSTAEISTDVKVVAHADDWQVVADGSEQPINEGEVTVAAGTAVTFTNAEGGVHTITVDGEKQGEDISGTDSRAIIFEEAGSHAITCDYHPSMRAVINVS